jgi:hypothetical protein
MTTLLGSIIPTARRICLMLSSVSMLALPALSAHAQSYSVTLTILNSPTPTGDTSVVAGTDIEVEFAVVDPASELSKHDTIRLVRASDGSTLHQKQRGKLLGGSVSLPTTGGDCLGEVTVEYVHDGVVITTAPPGNPIMVLADAASQLLSERTAANEEAIEDLQQGLDAQVSQSDTADAALQEAIDAEAAARIAADDALRAAVSDESASRAAADAALSSDLNAEEAARIAADDAEAAARQAGDSQLQTNIDAEAAAREEGLNRLQADFQSDLDAEVELRLAADDALQAGIDELIGRVEALEVTQPLGVLEGNYSISNSEDITYLCSRYEEITGNLTIADTDLTNLEGLTCLLRVGGGIFIHNNPSLTDIAGLRHLNSLGEGINPRFHSQPISIWLSSTPVTNFGAFGNIYSVGIIWIEGPEITSLLGFENLVSVRDFFIRDTLIHDLHGLDNLTTVGTIFLRDNPNLTDLSGLGSVSEIAQLWIHNSDNFQSFGGFGARELIGLDIRSCDSITSLGSLNGTKLRYLYVFFNDALTRLASFFPNVTADGIIWTIYIQGNDSLANLDELETLTDGMLLNGVEIEYNGALTSIAALRNIQGINFDLTITDNPILPTIGEAEALRDAIGVGNIGGSITISGNGPG